MNATASTERSRATGPGRTSETRFLDIEWTPDALRWIEHEVASGTFASPEAAIGRAVDRLRSTASKAKLEAAIDGGHDTAEDVLRSVRARPGAP